MHVGRTPALIGGAIGILGAATAAGLAFQRRGVAVDRTSIDPSSTAGLAGQPSDRQRRVRTEDGLGLHAEEVGPPDAPLTVVFVHGYALNLTSFVFQRRAVRKRYGEQVRMVFYDQRSHGRSERSPARDCTLDQLGRDLDTVLRALVPTGPIVLVGHSMGGMTLMTFAAAHPEYFGPDGRVRAVALIDTSSGELRTVTLGLPSLLARVTAPTLPLVLRRAAAHTALIERGRALGKDLSWLLTKRLSFADPDVPPAVVAFCAGMIAATPVDVVAAFYPTLMAHDGREGLRSLQSTPVLIVGAENDALTPLAHSEALAAALPQARLVVVPRAGHLLMLERPERVNRPLLELLEPALTGAEAGTDAAAETGGIADTDALTRATRRPSQSRSA